MVDLDGDGQRDVITGSWPGRIYFYKGSADGGFACGRTLRHDGGAEIEPGRASAVFAADWDGDSDLDLIVGNIDGAVMVFSRIDGKSEPVFAGATTVQVAGKPIDLGSDSAPVVADWDGDGRADLLAGDGLGAVHWFRNTGKAGRPELQQPRVLIDAPQGVVSQRSEGAVPVRCTRSKICVTDWNEDGRLDLLVGEFGSHGGGASQALAEKRRKQLTETHRKLGEQITALDKARPGEDRRAREGRIAEREALCAHWVQVDQELSKDGVCWLGRVWLYLR